MRSSALQVHQIELELQNEELLRARAESEQALELYTDLYDFAPVGYFTLAADGKIVQANLAGARLLEMDRATLQGTGFARFVAVGERSAFADFLQRVFASETRQSCEVLIAKEGLSPVYLQLEASLAPDGRHARVAALDITKSKIAEQALQRSERQLRDSQRVARIGGWRWDLANNALEWSDETFRRFDKDPATFTPTVEYFVSLVHPDDRAAVQQAIHDSLANDAPYHIHPRITNESGRQWVLEGFGDVVRDAGGKPLRFAGTVQDITERSQAEAEREKLIRELQEAIARVKQLSGLLPICASCKKIRDDQGYWNQIEVYIRDHSEANFTHGICPVCAEKWQEEINGWQSGSR